MPAPQASPAKSSRRIRLRRRTALVLGLALFLPAFSLIYVVLPWALSLLTLRYGWSETEPATVNVLGLIPVTAGFAGLIWVLSVMIAQVPKLPEIVELDEGEGLLTATSRVLITHGPFAFSRNPMYLSGAIVLLGWAVFYGSVVILFVTIIGWTLGHFFKVPQEERGLEARFGDAYRVYRARVPRWIGIQKPDPKAVSLTAAHALLLLAAFAFSTWRTDDWAARNVFRVVLFSEAGLLAVWAALSGASWQQRAAVASAGWLFGWFLLAHRHPLDSTYWLGVYLLVPSFATLLLALAMQWSQRRRAKAVSARWQFTTSDLLMFTTVLAVSIMLVQWFLALRLSGESLFLLSEGSQLSLLLTVGMAVPPRLDTTNVKRVAGKLARLVVASVVAIGLGLVMQSYLSASWFWDALRGFRSAAAGVLWEDLFSIPTTVLFESLLAAVTLELLSGIGRTDLN